MTAAVLELGALLRTGIPIPARLSLITIAWQRWQRACITRVLATALAFFGRVEIVCIAAATAVRESLTDALVTIVMVAQFADPTITDVGIQQTRGLAEWTAALAGLLLRLTRTLMLLASFGLALFRFSGTWCWRCWSNGWPGIGSFATRRTSFFRVEIIGIAAVAAIVELTATGVCCVVVPSRCVVLTFADLGGQFAIVLGYLVQLNNRGVDVWMKIVSIINIG